MRNLSTAIAWPVFVVALSCDKSEPAIRSFEFREGQTFTYSFKAYIISSEDSQLVENSEYVIEVVSTSASVGTWDGLIEFKTHSMGSDSVYSTYWYQQTRDGLYDIAYRNAGHDPGISPKINPALELPNLMGLLLPSADLSPMKAKNILIDSTIVRDDIRLASPLPLAISTDEWTEFSDPFLRTSKVVSDSVITVHNKPFHTYKIESSLPEFGDADLKVFTFLSNRGMVKRKVKSVAIITEDDSPEEIGRYISVLIIELTDFQL